MPGFRSHALSFVAVVDSDDNRIIALSVVEYPALVVDKCTESGTGIFTEEERGDPGGHRGGQRGTQRSVPYRAPRRGQRRGQRGSPRSSMHGGPRGSYGGVQKNTGRSGPSLEKPLTDTRPGRKTRAQLDAELDVYIGGIDDHYDAAGSGVRTGQKDFHHQRLADLSRGAPRITGKNMLFREELGTIWLSSRRGGWLWSSFAKRLKL
ncbi:hypothetical protein F4776DRAFT_667778 [Hypoxylon sp. NC0597]|nr:hypothetical protein F4776DRAFT_667778 [Hypoxylon sp. NC0597]